MEAAEVGRLLFGRPCRLALALWILRNDKPRFYQSEPPREVILQGALSSELGRLVRLGMLDEERPDDGRRVYYLRTSSSLWKIFQGAAEALESIGALTDAASSPIAVDDDADGQDASDGA